MTALLRGYEDLDRARRFFVDALRTDDGLDLEFTGLQGFAEEARQRWWARRQRDSATLVHQGRR